jgi:hypothetical protein
MSVIPPKGRVSYFPALRGASLKRYWEFEAFSAHRRAARLFAIGTGNSSAIRHAADLHSHRPSAFGMIPMSGVMT